MMKSYTKAFNGLVIMAADNGRLEIVKLLYSKGALGDNDINDILLRAAECGHTNIANWAIEMVRTISMLLSCTLLSMDI